MRKDTTGKIKGFYLSGEEISKLEKMAKDAGLSQGKVISNLIKNAKSVKVEIKSEEKN